MSEIAKVATMGHIDVAVGFFGALREELESEGPRSPSLERCLRAGVMRVMYGLGRSDKGYGLRRDGRFATTYRVNSSVIVTATTVDLGINGFAGPHGRPLIWAFESGTPDDYATVVMCDNTGAISLASGLMHEAQPENHIDYPDQLDCIDTFVGDYFTDSSRVERVI